MTAVLTSCDAIRNQWAALSESALQTDSISYEKTDKHSSVKLAVHYPMSGNRILVNAIREFINEELGGTYDDNLSEPQNVIATYGVQARKRMIDIYNEMNEDGNPYASEMVMEYEREITKTYETDLFVTYTSSFYEFTGGAHGSHGAESITFRKSDGRRFGYDMMRNLDSDAFHQLLKRGLKSYFSENGMPVISDQELRDCLLTDDDINWLPRPQSQPCITQNGIVFTYQTYEIAPYAAGMPSFTVNFKDIKPFLTASAVRLFEK